MTLSCLTSQWTANYNPEIVSSLADVTDKFTALLNQDYKVDDAEKEVLGRYCRGSPSP